MRSQYSTAKPASSYAVTVSSNKTNNWSRWCST